MEWSTNITLAGAVGDVWGVAMKEACGRARHPGPGGIEPPPEIPEQFRSCAHSIRVSPSPVFAINWTFKSSIFFVG